MESNKKAMVVLSGGLDSTVLLHWAIAQGYAVTAVHVQYGSKHSGNEMAAARATCRSLKVPLFIENINLLSFNSSLLVGSSEDIPEGHYEDESMKSTVVPFRNGILLSYVAGLAESMQNAKIFYGAHSGDHAIYPDCTPEFIAAMKAAIQFGTYNNVVLAAPFCDLVKSEIVHMGIKLAVNFSNTWTCYKGRELSCGKCGSCVERLEAFKVNKTADPIKYEE